MRATMLCLATLVAVAAPGDAVHAQQAPAAVGERVRIATAVRYGKFSYVGRVVALQGDSVSVQIGGIEGTQAIPLSEITNLEVSGGTTTNGRKGMLWGTVAGAAAGAIVGAVSYQNESGGCGSQDFCYGGSSGGPGSDALGGAIVGGLLGLGIGGIIGVTHKTERWISRTVRRRPR